MKDKEIKHDKRYWDLDRNGRILSMSDREIMDAKYPKKNMKQQLPDARKHQIISFIKSGIRILGYALIPFSLVTATIILILSEIVGIIEELV
jgi:hypothetical protein|tara:strand:+ start:922 stop:1197 length:276 start_codon:yes stop_codon:yes gene_type:complete